MTLPRASQSRLSVLDGWRGISIASVLACHMLPLGPQALGLNETAGPLGMVLFFILSGFLITSNLLERPDARSFFIRRACRILPLAVVFIVVALAIQRQPPATFAAHLCFYVNYNPDLLTPLTSPLWSLCVEIQFYLFVGILVLLVGRRGLMILPLLCVAVTGLRVWQHVHLSLFTHLRIDEILAGATLALVNRNERAASIRAAISRLPLAALLVLLLVCCHPMSGPINYLRPYAAAMVVANTLWRRQWLTGVLEGAALKYLADVSYALYVVHPIMRLGWLGTGGGFERYLLKRPVGFAIAFALAHLSTFYYEKRWIEWGKRLASRRRETAPEMRREAVATVQ